MEDIRSVLLDSTLELVTFFNIFKEDILDQINNLAADLDRCVGENDDVEIIHTGSGFEKLFLPHMDQVEDFDIWNTDADHMIIKTDTHVRQECSEDGWLMSSNGENVNGKTDVAITAASVEKEFTTLSTDDNNNVVYIYDGLHSGYVFVSNKILQRPIDSAFIKKYCRMNSAFIESCQGMIPLRRKVLMGTDGKITGPSYSLSLTGSSFIIHRDFVYGLKCMFWPSQAQEWINRERVFGWPSKELISASATQGCHIVPVGSHTSNLKEFEWRFSFSKIELKLAHSMKKNQKLTYSILKVVIKNEMKRRGINVFASYHLKTALFWFLEKRDEKLWERQSLGTNIIELLDFFTAFYADGFLPNYFISNNNMIDHRSQDELANACIVLKDIKSDLTATVCRYIEANQALPVFFDISLTQLLQEHREKFLQICKYNFLVMALAYILKPLKKGQSPTKQTDAAVYKLVHKVYMVSNFQNSDLLSTFSAFDEKSPVEIPKANATSVLKMIEECLEADKMKVTETSAVVLAVFNLFLTFHPTSLDRVSFPVTSLEYHNYFVQPTVVECLLWAGRLHEKHCDVIYNFVVKKWVNGPEFHTKDEQAKKLMKLLMVILGKPTKQASAVTGSLVKRHIDGQRFLILRGLAEYLLHIHPESSYIGFQASAYLMAKPVFSEIYNFVEYGSNPRSKLRALELILSKDELQVELSEKEFEKLVQLQHELSQKTGCAS